MTITTTTTSNRRHSLHPIANLAFAALAVFVVAGCADQPAESGEATSAQSNVIEDRPTESTPIVIGTGPNAVYVGPAPTFGGGPARGETDDSFFARTGWHLPGGASAAVVDGGWWYGPAPVTGGDPALGETDDSYFARTGRHLPAPRPPAGLNFTTHPPHGETASTSRGIATTSW